MGRDASMCHFLLAWRDAPIGDSGEGMDEQFSAKAGKALRNIRRRFVQADISGGLLEDVAGIESGIDLHGSYAGLRIAARESPLDRRGAAQFGQQRCMNVDDAARRDIDDVLRDDLAVADDYHYFRSKRAQMFHRLGAANPFGLKNADGVAQRHLLYGRGRELLFTPLRAIRLRDDFQHFMACRDHSFECGNSEIGGSEKNSLQLVTPTPPPFVVCGCGDV